LKILIAEDERELQLSIKQYLERDGNICEIASDFKETNQKIAIYDYDILILDINLKTGSGLDILRTIKKDKKEIGVIIISANNSLEDKLEGLDIGADDYVTKPFHLAELNSRIKAVQRRGSYGGNDSIEFNEIRVDTRSRTTYVDNKSVALTRKEYDLLLFFISNQGRVLSKEIIAEHLWGDNSDLLDNFDFIYVHINNLRKKLKDAGTRYIKTAYGSGYKFIAE
jgi:DNA-binding response OmpR family regulator